MSEYQTLESIYRLLGHNGEEGLFGLSYDRVDGSGTLLFDEIEKAHERVLDLFLQLKASRPFSFSRCFGSIIAYRTRLQAVGFRPFPHALNLSKVSI
jgi:hypothetical protein